MVGLSRRKARFVRLCLTVWLVALPLEAGAQVPSNRAEALRLIEQDPEAVRQRLLQSGLSQNEIRAQLRAAGLPATSLDAFLSGDPIDPATAFTEEALSALERLGVAVETPDGLEFVPLETGMRPGLLPPDSIEGVPIFGLDVFTRATSQFQPLLYGPVPDEYRLGPGDRLVLVLTGEVELARELEVTRAGFVVIPDVGQVGVANLTMGELRSLLRQRLSQAYSGIERGTTTFNLTLSELRTIQVSVAGEVNQPGSYQLASVATVLNALYAAGGPTDLGNMRRIQVHRRDGEQRDFDLYPYLMIGDVSGDVMLEQGDIVFVPLRGRRVQVLGAVVRPAHYELAAGDGLLDVLRTAGGFAPEALRRRLTINRVLHPADRGPGLADRQAIDLELRATKDSTAPNYLGGVLIPPVVMQDGDSIVVDSIPSLEEGYYVTIAGSVRKPGPFPWQEGMTIRELVELARGPIVGADLREAEVSRLAENRQNGALAERLRVPLDSSYLSQRNLEGRFRGPPGVPFPPPGSSPEFELEPYDQVLIPQQPDFEIPQAVSIAGEISIPGRYTLLTKSDKVSDLVDRAGGVLPTGYVEGARLFRLQDQLGRLDLDLVAAMQAPGTDADLILQPGDSLFIPEYSPTVLVRGAVNSPVTVLYRPGEGLDYYIANAGGYRDDADEGRVSVRYANGQARTRSKFLFWSSYPEPGPGSEVVVPVEPPAPPVSLLEIMTPLVSVLGTVTALIIAASR